MFGLLDIYFYNTTWGYISMIRGNNNVPLALLKGNVFFYCVMVLVIINIHDICITMFVKP